MDKHRRGIGGLYLVVAIISIIGGVLEITANPHPGGWVPIVFCAQAVLFAVLGMLHLAKPG
jgi:hypothetical protein